MRIDRLKIRCVNGALAAAALFALTQAQAQPRDRLVDMINAYRAAPPACNGKPGEPLGPLAPQPALARVQVGTGVFLEHALERIGYPVAQAEMIYLTGPQDANAVMEAIGRRYCRTLLSPQFSAIGTSRSGDNWQIVFAHPAPPPLATRLPKAEEAGQTILAAVNTARMTGRACGEQFFPAAPTLSWNSLLASAALAHSADMAKQRYFNHKAPDGSTVGERALQAGYRWRKVGENIAAGQESAEEAVAGWLTSPGHCANIMNPGFSEMGAAYGFSTARELPRVYWTQVFGAPR